MDEITPLTRIELWLAKIIGQDVTPPVPCTRVEKYLANVAGGSYPLPSPVSRWELYLAKILGQNVELPAPQSRADFYLAKIAGVDVELPEPRSRQDAFLYAWAGGGPAPEYETVGPTSLATFTTLRAAPLKALSVAIEPVQDLHGYSNPWPAGGGVNLLPPMVDGTYEGNGVKAVVKNGIATLSGTTTSSGNALIIPLSKTWTAPASFYYHLGNSAVNVSLAPSIENSSSPATGQLSLACSPANRITAEYTDREGITYDRIRFYIANNVTISGTYAPMICLDNTARSYVPYSNICPISGWTQAKVWRTGKNLFEMTLADIKAANTDGTWTGDKYIRHTLEFTFEQENGFVTAIIANGTPTGQANLKLRSTTLPLIKGTSYKLNGCPSGGSIDSYGLWATQSSVTDYGSGATFTADGTTVYNGRIRIVQGTVCNDLTFRPMIRLSADDAAFAPYSGTTLTIDLDGTRYGGTLDALTGVLTVDRVLVTNDGSSSGTYGYGTFPYISMPGGAIYKDGTPAAAITNIAVPTGITNGYILRFANGIAGVTDKASFGTLLSNTPMQIVASLATPVTYQLTPEEVTTLLGENNIWADTGDVTVTYQSN